MKVVYKYPIGGDTTLSLPRDSKVLTAAVQHGQLQMWILVNFAEGATYESRRFIVVGTGHNMPDGEYRHITTLLTEQESLVLHVLEHVASILPIQQSWLATKDEKEVPPDAG